MKLTYFGKVENGVLKLRARKQFDEDIKNFEGKDVEITLERKKSKRSDNQNRYYFGVVVQLIMERFKELGHDVSKEDTHVFLRSRFLYTEIVDEKSGEIMRIPKSTTELNKMDF